MSDALKFVYITVYDLGRSKHIIFEAIKYIELSQCYKLGTLLYWLTIFVVRPLAGFCTVQWLDSLA